MLAMDGKPSGHLVNLTIRKLLFPTDKGHLCRILYERLLQKIDQRLILIWVDHLLLVLMIMLEPNFLSWYIPL